VGFPHPKPNNKKKRKEEEEEKSTGEAWKHGISYDKYGVSIVKVKRVIPHIQCSV
jgi:hypothetical protein